MDQNADDGGKIVLWKQQILDNPSLFNMSKSKGSETMKDKIAEAALLQTQ